MANTVPYSV